MRRTHPGRRRGSPDRGCVVSVTDDFRTALRLITEHREAMAKTVIMTSEPLPAHVADYITSLGMTVRVNPYTPPGKAFIVDEAAITAVIKGLA